MKVIKIGTSLGIILDKTILETTNFKEGDELKCEEIKKNKITIIKEGVKS